MLVIMWSIKTTVLAHLPFRGPHTRDIFERSDTLHFTTFYTCPNLFYRSLSLLRAQRERLHDIDQFKPDTFMKILMLQTDFDICHWDFEMYMLLIWYINGLDVQVIWI